jgi:hypothetical protein
MQFSFKDVIRCPRVAFSAKKIWVGFLGLLFGTILYSVMTYFAYASSPDWTWKEIWREFRYIPVPIIGTTHLMWYGWISWVFGIVFFVAINLLAIGAIAKLTYEQLRGDEFYEVGDAIKHSLKQWKVTLASPLVLVIFIGSLILVGFMCGLIGRIPYVGQVLAGLFFIPVAFGALFVVYLGIVFVASLCLSPTVSNVSDSDTFDTLFEVFSCLNDQTWRLVLWEIFTVFCVCSGVWILGWLVKKGLLLMYWAARMWAGVREVGEKTYCWWESIWNNGLCYLSPCPPIHQVENIVGRIAPVLIYTPKWVSVNIAEWIGGFLIGLSFYFLMFFVLAYGISIWGVGQTFIYLVLVKIKDEKNLLEKKEEEFEEEEIEEEKEEEKKEEKEEEEKVTVTEGEEKEEKQEEKE